MSVSLEVAVRDLRVLPLADPKQHLKPLGRREVLQEIERWSARGLRAHVLVVDPEDSFAELLGAWERLRLDPDRDLLLIFNTRDWVARGWGLDEAQLRRALADALPVERTVFSQQLISGLRALSRLAKPPAASDAANDSADGLSLVSMLGGAGALAVGAVVGLAIRRRHQLAKAGVAQLREARASAERTYTELILACEELPVPEDGTELQLRAAELKRRLDQVSGGVRERPVTGNDPVRIGEIRQLEDELAALRSSALQKQKERL